MPAWPSLRRRPKSLLRSPRYLVGDSQTGEGFRSPEEHAARYSSLYSDADGVLGPTCIVPRYIQDEEDRPSRAARDLSCYCRPDAERCSAHLPLWRRRHGKDHRPAGDRGAATAGLGHDHLRPLRRRPVPRFRWLPTPAVGRLSAALKRSGSQAPYPAACEPVPGPRLPKNVHEAARDGCGLRTPRREVRVYPRGASSCPARAVRPAACT